MIKLGSNHVTQIHFVVLLLQIDFSKKNHFVFHVFYWINLISKYPPRLILNATILYEYHEHKKMTCSILPDIEFTCFFVCKIKKVYIKYHKQTCFITIINKILQLQIKLLTTVDWTRY